MKINKEELEFLIESHRKMKERKGLSGYGESYLEGLEKAYDILFPIQIAEDTQSCSNQNQNPQNAREGESNVRTRKQSADSSVDAPGGCGKLFGGMSGHMLCGYPCNVMNCKVKTFNGVHLCPACTQLHSNKSEANKE